MRCGDRARRMRAEHGEEKGMMGSWRAAMRAISGAAAMVLLSPMLPASAQTTTIDTGTLAGTSEGAVQAFRGIPYAAPPVGPLRWKPPQPAARWTGTREANAYGNACPQPARNTGRVEEWAQVGPQSEDCLFLNVWRPAKPGRYPVMVFFHGGSFTFGAAGVKLYNGADLAARGVVVVTVNYRLGRLGFFAHPALTRENPDGQLGNYAMMDAVAALQWVKRNVAQFGGNPGNVTIFGESAGAGMVQLLMGMPMAEGLFHKAASHSGSGSSLLAPIRGGPVNAEMLGQAWTVGLGLKDATVEQLRAIPVDEVVKARAFPFIDGKVVVRSPGEPFYQGKQARVPFIIGANSNEATLGGMTEATARALLGGRFTALRDGYVAATGKPTDAATIDLAEDLGFVLPSFALADRHAAAGNRTYAYFFDQVYVDDRGKLPGTGHGGELEYLFNTKDGGHSWDAQDRAVSKLMGDYWVRFARTGNPNGGGAPNWPAVSSQPTAYLHITANSRAERLAPVQEQAKAAAMEKPVKQWTGK